MDLNIDGILPHASRVRPCSGERVSGDSTVFRPLETGLFVAIVDVLGHGPEAHEVSLRIDTYLERYGSSDVGALLERLHLYLKGTRGAAVGLCAFDAASGTVEYAGIGNTVLRRFGSDETRLVSRPGVVGQNMRSPLQQTLELEPGDLVVLYTDGISDRFSEDEYPGLRSEAPDDVARRIIDRFGKDYDDASCIAVRYAA